MTFGVTKYFYGLIKCFSTPIERTNILFTNYFVW